MFKIIFCIRYINLEREKKSKKWNIISSLNGIFFLYLDSYILISFQNIFQETFLSFISLLSLSLSLSLSLFAKVHLILLFSLGYFLVGNFLSFLFDFLFDWKFSFSFSLIGNFPSLLFLLPGVRIDILTLGQGLW